MPLITKQWNSDTSYLKLLDFRHLVIPHLYNAEDTLGPQCCWKHCLYTRLSHFPLTSKIWTEKMFWQTMLISSARLLANITAVLISDMAKTGM